jgi:hypothetical protein
MVFSATHFEKFGEHDVMPNPVMNPTSQDFFATMTHYQLVQ